ncbi:hypothetical protein D6219_06995 [Coxiella burnetii]|nr:hypothetical protein D6219_06995 [Coxiella burnetii]PNT85590.1 hypothetical protein C2L93_04925 [Coxiella burnetii]RQM60782.1 hypothetical protein EHS23_04610 [Coxiella burnetii]RQM67214.1 hypothetical protein EHS22_04595 [Coxiella burnetii]
MSEAKYGKTMMSIVLVFRFAHTGYLLKTTFNRTRAFTAEIMGISAKRLRKAPSVFFLTP